jgi:hypothetical protein
MFITSFNLTGYVLKPHFYCKIMVDSVVLSGIICRFPKIVERVYEKFFSKK